MVILDDHLALLAITGNLPDLGLDRPGPIATTYGFHYRLARSVVDMQEGARGAGDKVTGGSLALRVTGAGLDAVAMLQRVLAPPAYRLAVLDPRITIERAAGVARRHRVNLLLAELVGAALYHGAAIRVTPPNVGTGWTEIMRSEGIDFATVVA